jgi:hypothetical protein
MSALEDAAAEAEATATRETVRLGRILVWAAILPYALLEVILLSLALSNGVVMHIVATVVRVVLDVTVVWMTVNGSLGARRLLAFLCGAGFVVSLFMLVGANALMSLVLGATLIECGFALWVFRFSTAATLYLDSNVHVVESFPR